MQPLEPRQEREPGRIEAEEAVVIEVQRAQRWKEGLLGRPEQVIREVGEQVVVEEEDLNLMSIRVEGIAPYGL